jgi:hypothetical protein
MKGNFVRVLRISLRDLLESYHPALRILAGTVFFLPVCVFALRLLRFDRDIGAAGLRAAAGRFFSRLYGGIREEGQPPSGAGGLLILCNHPGAGDSLALISRIPRGDLFPVVHDREFFRALPELYARTVPVPDDPKGRILSVREMARRLKEGGAVLLYPAGKIEPDPALPPEAGGTTAESAVSAYWTDAAGLLAVIAGREGFEFGILPVIVAGVIPEKALHSYVPWGVADRETQEKRAVGRIVGFGAARTATVTICWGQEESASQLRRRFASSRRIMDHLRGRAAELAMRRFPPENS